MTDSTDWMIFRPMERKEMSMADIPRLAVIAGHAAAAGINRGAAVGPERPVNADSANSA